MHAASLNQAIIVNTKNEVSKESEIVYNPLFWYAKP